MALKGLEDLFLELTNVKSVEYGDEVGAVVADVELTEGRWRVASDGDLRVLLDTERDAELLGEGVMRDLARRVQALRKELGFVPTDVLGAVYLAGLDAETRRLLMPFLVEMAGLVRAGRVSVFGDRVEVKDVAEGEWHEFVFDDKRVYVAVVGR